MTESNFSEVFDSRFLRRLEALTLRVSKFFKNNTRGDRRSRRRGHAPEFAEHRVYRPGDDIRRIDWLAYARLGDLVIKEHAADQDLVVHLLLDCSASMNVHGKFTLARQIAAAMIYIALAGGDRLRLQIFTGGKLGQLVGPMRGKRNFGKVLDYLATLQATGETGIDAVCRRFVASRPSPGLVIVVSDFLNVAESEASLKRLQFDRYECVALHVLSKEELQPTLSGDLDLSDAESGETMTINLDRAALKLYQQKLNSYLDQFQGFCLKHKIAYLLASEDQSLEQILLNAGRKSRLFQ